MEHLTLLLIYLTVAASCQYLFQLVMLTAILRSWKFYGISYFEIYLSVEILEHCFTDYRYYRKKTKVRKKSILMHFQMLP